MTLYDTGNANYDSKCTKFKKPLYVEQGNKIKRLYGSWQKQGFVKVRAVGLWECPIRKLPLCNNTTTHAETLTEY